jgi:hypothetical protein
MKRMGMYCKAYTVSQLRQFAGWIENAQSLDTKEAAANGEEIPENRILSDDDLVYLQENHVVTKDILLMKTSSSLVSRRSGKTSAEEC